MISTIEQESMDIDWFFTNTVNIGFVASGGGKLPNSIAENWEVSREVVSFIKELPIISDILINPKLGEIINATVNDRYLHDFVAMARKGIFAFDRTVLNNFSDLSYHLVAWPIDPLDYNTLPNDIKAKIIGTRYFGVLNEKLSVASVS